MENLTRHRGRPKKVKISDDERLEELLFKLYYITCDSDGKLTFERNDSILTLDDTAFLLWNSEGRKTAKPLSKMMILKTEQRALQKLKVGLAKIGINNFSDVFGKNERTFAVNKYGITDDPE